MRVGLKRVHGLYVCARLQGRRSETILARLALYALRLPALPAAPVGSAWSNAGPPDLQATCGSDILAHCVLTAVHRQARVSLGREPLVRALSSP